MQQRVVVVEGMWPNHAFEEGIGINLLTSADPGLAPRRRGVPRHLGMAAAGVQEHPMSDNRQAALPTERHSAEVDDFLRKLQARAGATGAAAAGG